MSAKFYGPPDMQRVKKIVGLRPYTWAYDLACEIARRQSSTPTTIITAWAHAEAHRIQRLEKREVKP